MAGPTGCGRHVGGALGRVGALLPAFEAVTGALDLGGSSALAFICLCRRQRQLNRFERLKFRVLLLMCWRASCWRYVGARIVAFEQYGRGREGPRAAQHISSPLVRPRAGQPLVLPPCR
jgi:hypothetical protein